MARKQKPAVQRYHDRVARRYDASYDDEYWQLHDRLTWDYIKPFLPADQGPPVLDLGCGTGKWGARLARSGYRVTCVDIAGAMVAQARRKLEEVSTSTEHGFVQADLMDLGDLPAATFSLALAMGDPLGCTTQPARALKEIRKRMRPGGVLIATLDNKLAALNYYVEQGSPQRLSQFLKTGRTHWLTRDEDEQFEIHTYTPREAERLLETAGFEVLDLRGKLVLDLRRHRKHLEDPEARRAWMQLEKRLGKDRDAIATAGHLQIAARVP